MPKTVAARTRVQVYLTDARVIAGLNREAKASKATLSQAAGRAIARGLAKAPQADPEDRLLQLERSLRDRIVVGEMREGAAALETLKSWNTGHPGGLSTLHANSAEEALRRLEDLIAEVSSTVPRRAIGQAVDRIVHIRRTPEGRRVETVLAVDGAEDDGYRMRTLA